MMSFITSFPHEEMVFALRIAVIPCFFISHGPPWLKPLEERLAAKQRMEQDQRSHLGRAVAHEKTDWIWQEISESHELFMATVLHGTTIGC